MWRPGVRAWALALVLAVPLLSSSASHGGTGDSYSLRLSTSANRSGAVDLDGRLVSGAVYVFTSPDTSDIRRVRFWLDDPSRSGTPWRTENSAPYDFNGGSEATAKPLDTATIADGSHTITTAIEFAGGGQSVVHAGFTVQNTGSTAALTFSPGSLSLAAEQGGPTVSKTAALSTSNGTGATFTVSESAPWLAVAPSSGTTPASLTFTADPSGLAAGSYSHTVTAQAGGFTGAAITVGLTVSGAGQYSLLVSSAANRASPTPLDGATVAGGIYAFTAPDTADISRVRFWLDDPSMSVSPRRTENTAPYDFNGGTVTTAAAFDTRSIADGQHTITAAIDLPSGTQVVHATFTVQNAATPSLAFDPATLSLTAAPGGAPVSRTAGLRASSGSAVFSVADTATWLSVTPTTGSTPATLTFTADPAGLTPGTHTATVTAQAAGYVSAAAVVSFVVAGAPDQIHLAWTGDPATTMTVVWRTWTTGTPSTVEYRAAGAATWQQQSGTLRSSGTTGTLHQTTLSGLTPGTAYQYRVRGDGAQWSPVFTTRTASASGDLEFVYVADTGLVGRLDGLATGTQQVVDEIARLGPLLVLGGGDYAYYNTDQRYGTLENTIDAWFNQMQPVAASAPLMPTYGNHEILLGEGYGPWAARFPTPAGIGGPDNRQNYSFDVGDVHFVSIMAVSDTQGLPSAVLAWIDADLAAARAAGSEWLIPFFHATPFGDGTNHDANPVLRGQLAPIFERHGVKLAIASQDQAYERSYPLTGVTSSAYSISSASRRCYDLEDGVTWVKVSPGGKLSNISRSFSPFASEPAPTWTAFRDNTLHHFARVAVTSDGVLRFEAHGVRGDGSAPVVQDAFEYRTAGCARSLELDRVSLDLEAAANGGAVTRTVRLAASDGGSVPFTASSSAPWLAVSPQAGTTATALGVSANPSALLPGTYTAVVTASASGYESVSLPVTLTVEEAAPYSLVVSRSADRSNPSALQGASVSQNVYVFTSPDTSGIAGVRFYLDDPAMTGSPRRRESNAPYDFNGGTVELANAFDTRALANGSHTITAAIELSAGGEHVLHASFEVRN